MEGKRRISAPFLRTGLNNYRQSKTAVQPKNTIIVLIQAEIADNIFSPIILWCQDAGWNNRSAIVLCHLLIDSIDALVFPALIVLYSSTAVVRHENLCNTAKVLVHMDMSSDP